LETGFLLIFPLADLFSTEFEDLMLLLLLILYKRLWGYLIFLTLPLAFLDGWAFLPNTF
jgi:hypothetical protein